MLNKINVLRFARDRNDRQLVIYYRINDHIQKLKPPEEIERLQKRIQGIIDTERFLKGDPIAKPDPEIVNASDCSVGFFNELLYTEEGEKYRREYLKDLPSQRAVLSGVIDGLEQIILAYEAGVLEENNGRIPRVLDNLGVGRFLPDGDAD